MKVIDDMDYANGHALSDSHLSIGFDKPMVMKTGTFPPSLDKLIDMARQRLILYVNGYGDGPVIPDFQCAAWTKSSSMHFHKLKRASQRAGKREIHAYTCMAHYTGGSMNEQAKKLLKIGELIGAGPKPSFGLGFYRVMDK
jgi:CRISPR/Cas system endoribonuclease Cas6 (RAMP superfamily)